MNKYKVEFTLFDPKDGNQSNCLRGMLDRIIEDEAAKGGGTIGIGRPGGYKGIMVEWDSLGVTKMEPVICTQCNGTGEVE